MSVCWRRELSPVRGPTTARECCVVCRRCVVNVLFAVVLVQSMCLPSCDCLSVVVCFANSNVRKRRESTSNSGERSYRSTRTRTRGASCNTQLLTAQSSNTHSNTRSVLYNTRLLTAQNSHTHSNTNLTRRTPTR